MASLQTLKFFCPKSLACFSVSLGLATRSAVPINESPLADYIQSDWFALEVRVRLL